MRSREWRILIITFRLKRAVFRSRQLAHNDITAEMQRYPAKGP